MVDLVGEVAVRRSNTWAIPIIDCLTHYGEKVLFSRIDGTTAQGVVYSSIREPSFILHLVIGRGWRFLNLSACNPEVSHKLVWVSKEGKRMGGGILYQHTLPTVNHPTYPNTLSSSKGASTSSPGVPIHLSSRFPRPLCSQPPVSPLTSPSI